MEYKKQIDYRPVYLFKALSNSKRLRIVIFLNKKSPLTLTEIASLNMNSRNTTLYHLEVLLNENIIIKKRKVGISNYYINKKNKNLSLIKKSF